LLKQYKTTRSYTNCTMLLRNIAKIIVQKKLILSFFTFLFATHSN